MKRKCCPGSATRRRWLADCTALAFAGLFCLPAAVRAQGTRPPAVVLVVGDSLSAEYGLARGSGWVSLMAARVAQQQLPVRVVNASISGDTTAGGVTRLPSLLAQDKPSVVVLELGANDALRGLPLAMTRQNLDTMAKAAKAAGARVVIIGMQVPPNYGRQYTDEFAGLFSAVAQADGASLVPFLLAGVADSPNAESLFQQDGLHPKAEAHPRILDNVWPVLVPLLKH